MVWLNEKAFFLFDNASVASNKAFSMIMLV
jgi:hypothetical protein